MINFLGMIVFGAIVGIGALDLRNGLTVFGMYRAGQTPETGPRPAGDGGHGDRPSRRRGRREADPQPW